MAYRQSWTNDLGVLSSYRRIAEIDSLSSIREDILKKSGATQADALGIDESGNMVIDLNVSPYMSYDFAYNKQIPNWDDMSTRQRASASKNRLKPMLPIKTGNLRENAFKVRPTPGEESNWGVYIDEAVAPYVKYPNVKRIIDQQWPLIRAKFQNNMKGYEAALTGGLYNNKGAEKMLGGGYYNDRGILMKTAGYKDGEKSRWDFVGWENLDQSSLSSFVEYAKSEAMNHRNHLPQFGEEDLTDLTDLLRYL